ADADTPVPRAPPVPSPTHAPPANCLTNTLVTPPALSSHATTGPLAVLITVARSAVPVPLTPALPSDEPSAIQPPWPPFAAGSKLATRMSLVDAVNSVHATIGLPLASTERLVWREAPAVALMPPSCALPPSSCQPAAVWRAR